MTIGHKRQGSYGALVGILHLGPLLAGLLLLIAFGICFVVDLSQASIPPATLIFRSQTIGRMTAWIEAHAPHVLLLWATLGATLARVVHRFSRRQHRRLISRSELQLHRVLSRFGALACCFLFLFSLVRSWADATLPRSAVVSGHTSARLGFPQEPYSALFGLLPWSDAGNYYDGARCLADTGKLDDWNERRPLNATLLTVRLGLTGFDLRLATLIQALLLALVTFFLADELSAHLGIWAGIGGVAVVLAYGRLFQATTLSETLGIVFGAIGITLLYRGVMERRPIAATGGLASIALGMSARSGAVFVVPSFLLVLFTGKTTFRTPRWKALVGALFATVLSLSWAPLLNRTYGTSAGVVGSDFAYVSCGLALGGTWLDATQTYQTQLASLASERERADFLYHRAFALAVHNPRPLLGRLRENARQFLVSIPDWFQGLVLFESPGNTIATGTGILLLGGIALYFFAPSRESEIGFWVAGWTGFLLSVPFIFGNAGWRLLATSWPFVAAFLSTGLASPRRVAWAGSRTRRGGVARAAPWGCLLLLPLSSWIGPRLVQKTAARPDVTDCGSAQGGRDGLLVRTLDAGSSVKVIDLDSGRPGKVLQVDVAAYSRILEESGMEDAGSLLPPPERPFVLLWGYDYIGHRTHRLIAPGEVPAVRAPWLRLEVEPWRASRYFERVVRYGAWVPCDQAAPSRGR